MVSIEQELGAIKRNPVELLDARRIIELCRECGYRPQADGKLDPCTLIASFMQQIGGGNLSCEELRLMHQGQFTASGYCQARMRLPLGVIQTLAREQYQKLAEPLDREDLYRWHGHRVLLMDSSSFSMPDTPELKAHFGQPGQQKSGCGFPVAHVLMLFNARTGLAVDAITAPLRTHEMSIAAGTHQQMQQADLVVGDDSFGTYVHFALLSQRGLHGLFPLHHQRIADFTANRPHIEPAAVARGIDGQGRPRSRWIKSLGKDDQLVEWFKPLQRPRWMTHQQWKRLPDSLILREVRRTITRPGFRPVTLTIATTLLEEKKYPADALFEVRVRRWDVETDLRHLKTTMKMEVLHCKTVDGVHVDVPAGLQPGACSDGAGVAAAEGGGESNQFCQRVAVDAPRWSWGCVAGAGSGAPPTQSTGAACGEAKAQGIRPTIKASLEDAGGSTAETGGKIRPIGT
jgi:hypothetical protein